MAAIPRDIMDLDVAILGLYTAEDLYRIARGFRLIDEQDIRLVSVNIVKTRNPHRVHTAVFKFNNRLWAVDYEIYHPDNNLLSSMSNPRRVSVPQMKHTLLS